LITVTGNGTITEGDLCQTENGIQFRFLSTVIVAGASDINAQAVVAGSSGNVPANQIKYLPVSIPGITSISNAVPSSGGYDEESDSSLLQRYYEHIQKPSTSGNKYQYKEWAKSVTGVGDARVVPLWNGSNTVKVIIIDANKEPAEAALVGNVQDYIDPGVTGLGDGEAPLGAYCTVESAAGKAINISFTAVKDPSYTDQQRIDNVTAGITAYFQSIAFNDAITAASYAQIGNAILQSAGILDYSNLTINGGTANIPLATNEVPELGVLTIA
jgi:uncharacterized phage protein gp47/JayE